MVLETLLASLLPPVPAAEAAPPAHLFPSHGHAPLDPLEVEFGAFVTAIAGARERGLCRRLADCLSDPSANPLHESGEEYTFRADCADMPYALRAYFAWKRGAPFPYSEILREAGPTPIPPPPFPPSMGPDRFKAFQMMATFLADVVRADSFRVSGEGEETATYPVAVERDAIRAGTLFHDPDGHVLIVFRVNADGTVHLFDSQPNGLMSIKRVPADLYEPGVRGQGGGFRNWRPFQRIRVGAGAGKTGGESPFHLDKFSRNADLPDFDPESQYRGKYEVRGMGVGYWTWVRHNLAREDGRIRPVSEWGIRVRQLCDDISERVVAVDLARRAGLPDLPAHRIPRDAAGAPSAAWEEHSTPTRDLRLRTSLRGLKRFLLNTHRLVSEGKTTHIAFEGSPRDLVVAYETEWRRALASPACRFAFVDSLGGEVDFDVAHVMERAYDISFDPYHCPEMRWGFKPGSAGGPAEPGYASCARDSFRETRYFMQAAARTKLDDPAVREDLDVEEALSALLRSHGLGRPLADDPAGIVPEGAPAAESRREG